MALKVLNKKANGFMFYWKIKHFNLCSLLGESAIISPIFRVVELNETEWNLVLYPNKGCDVEINIHRLQKDEGPYFICVDIELFLLKTNGHKVIEEIKKKDFFAKSFSKKPLKVQRNYIFGNEEFLSDETLTVGCFIKRYLTDMPAYIECTAYSEISAEKFSFDFPVNIPLHNYIQQTIPITSLSKKYPNFKVILVSYSFSRNSEFLTIKIEMDTLSADVMCECQLSVEDSKNKILFLCNNSNKFLANSNYKSWSLTNSVTSSKELFDFKTNSSLLLRGTLFVSDGTVSSYIKDCNFSVSAFQNVPNVSINLSQMQKMKCLFEDSRLCDFTLQADGEEFQIHKAVLGAMSPVFCAMFELEMKEKESSKSTLEDIDANTLRKLIHFAYTENVENIEWESALNLYKAADRFQILELKQRCAGWLIANLKIENIPEVLTVSDMHEDSDLEKGATDFMFVNAKEVFRSENWKTFIGSNLRVANKVMQEMCIRFTPNHLSLSLGLPLQN